MPAVVSVTCHRLVKLSCRSVRLSSLLEFPHVLLFQSMLLGAVNSFLFASEPGIFLVTCPRSMPLLHCSVCIVLTFGNLSAFFVEPARFGVFTTWWQYIYWTINYFWFSSIPPLARSGFHICFLAVETRLKRLWMFVGQICPLKSPWSTENFYQIRINDYSKMC